MITFNSFQLQKRMKVAELKQQCSKPDVVEVSLIQGVGFRFVFGFLIRFLFLIGLGCYSGRSKAFGVFKILSKYCPSTKALVPETQILTGLYYPLNLSWE